MRKAKDQVPVSFESTGVIVPEGSEGLSHGVFVHRVGGLHAVSGSFDNETGSCVVTRPDGDRAFYVCEAAGKRGMETRATSSCDGHAGMVACR
jgi:hypothetical protein